MEGLTITLYIAAGYRVRLRPLLYLVVVLKHFAVSHLRLSSLL